MCKRHSFVQDKKGRIYDGHGFTHSHTAMADMAGFTAPQHDKLNAYEWQPPKDWPDSSYLEGLTVDRQAFSGEKS